MGIAKGAVSLLYELKQTTPFGGTVCQLGRQHLHFSIEQLSKIAERFGFQSDLEGPLTDETLFASLGFGTVESIDYSDFEQATHVHDFNQPIPEALVGRYDMIFDGGTLEHIFNFPRALENIHAMLKPGGLIVHLSPSHNHVDHGFYMFSPTVFHDYYRANNYEILRLYLFEYESDHAGRPWVVYQYTPAAVSHLSYGGWGHKLLGIWCVARKLPVSTQGVVPQQGYYVNAWEPEAASAGRSTASVLGRLKQYVKRHHAVEPAARAVWSGLRKRAPRLFFRRPKVIARY